MISIAIICKNEERIIEKCLNQAKKLADEIIVVDSGSTDNTRVIAEKFDIKFIYQDWLGYSAQKNYALDLCTLPWVLSLDADEVLTDELINEIKSLDLSKNFAFKIPRKLFIGERFIRWGGYYPDYQLRLVPKNQARFNDRVVHESMMLADSARDFPIIKLKYAINHYSYETIKDLERAFDKYALLARTESNLLLAIIKSGFCFFNKFFIQLGCLEGALGLALAWVHTKYTFRKYFWFTDVTQV
jgi:glycosyltransferase involved in cell wall biosynthesis